MEIKSKALEVNIADYHVDVEVDVKYVAFQEVMSKYYGLTDGLNTFLKELSHPYKNWDFIIQEARGYSLDYFHLLKTQTRGPEVAGLFVEIFTDAIEANSDPAVRADAVDNLLLYLQKIIMDADQALDAFMPVLNDIFQHIRNYDDETFPLFIKSYYQLNRLAEAIYSAKPDRSLGFNELNLLLLKYFQQTYAYWIGEGDPLTWFEQEARESGHREELDALFGEISLVTIQQHTSRAEEISGADLDARETLEMLLALPGYNQIVEAYRQFPRALLHTGADEDQGNRWKIIFLFHMMNSSGLSMIHEEALRDINRTLSWLIRHGDHANVEDLIERTFFIIKSLAGKFPATALNCVLNMGKGVYGTDDIDLINYFIDAVIDLGFQTPMISGVGNDWQIKVNTVHIQNIRTWLEVIELNPRRSIRLLSALIIHLSLSGVFLKDTDLFPRDITRFLNSDLEPVHNLAKQLTRLFPTFFNDIGAEGQLRDISTRIDEITHRRDILIHFLRKQSHVESSNLIIGFMEATLYFWETREKDRLEPFVPPNIFNQIDTRGIFVDGVHRVVTHLKEKGLVLPDDFISMSEDELKGVLADMPDGEGTDIQRVQLAVALYKLLYQKYHLDFFEMDHYLAQLRADAFPDLDKLKDDLTETNSHDKLSKLLDYLGLLKQLILSSKQYEIREDIYKKRHFTVDIPSMYGSYYELKFDALGLSYRIESLVNVLFEEIVESMDLGLITKATFFQIHERLLLFSKALKLDGISSAELDNQMDFLANSLEVRGFTFTQYIDIYKGFSRSVKNIINDHFNNIHEQNLNNILNEKPIDQILEKYLPRT
ncbi:MAG: pyruvate, phosphate dikinase, partial [Desulfobacterales bacterium]